MNKHQISGVAGEALTRNRFVTLNTTDNKFYMATGAEGENVIGVVECSYDSGSEYVKVVICGPAKLDIASALSLNDNIAVDANGKATKATLSSDAIVGVYNNPEYSGSTPRALVSGQRADITLLANKSTLNDSNGRRSLSFEYDFADDGGAISAIDLGESIPAGARILRSGYEVLTTFTSSTDAGTVALTAGTATIQAAVAISNGANAYDAGYFDGAHDGTATQSEKLSANGAHIRRGVIHDGTFAIGARREIMGKTERVPDFMRRELPDTIERQFGRIIIRACACFGCADKALKYHTVLTHAKAAKVHMAF